MIALLGLTIVLIAGGLTLRQRRAAIVSDSDRADGSFLEKLWASGQQMSGRLVYPYSVVPGGVETVEEGLRAARRDPLVAAHYRDFDFRHAVVTKLPEDRFVHVSYRLDNKIYWTKKKVRVAAGEPVITDGREYIRGRCGNRLLDVSPRQFSELEPPEGVMDVPSLPLLTRAMRFPGAPPEFAPPESGGPEFAPPVETPADVLASTPTPDFFPPGSLTPGTTTGGFVVPPVVCCGGVLLPPPVGTTPPPTTPPDVPVPPVTPPTTPPVNPPPVTPPPVNPPPVNPPPVNPPPVTPPPVNPPPVNPPPVTPPPDNPPPVNPPPVNPPPVNPPPVTPPPVTPPPVDPPLVNPPPVTPPPDNPPVYPPPVTPPPDVPPPSPVPEPGTMGLVGVALCAAAWTLRRRAR